MGHFGVGTALAPATRNKNLMGNRTTGQHFIPRFFLEGFVAVRKKEEAYTYQFRKGVPNAILCNIKDAAKRRLFYGEPSETGIEDALAKEEYKYAPILKELIKTHSLSNGDLAEFCEFVANLTIRSRHLRYGFQTAARDTYSGLREIISSESGLSELAVYYTNHPGLTYNSLRESIRKIPNLPREPKVHLALDSIARILLDKVLSSGEPDVTQSLESFFVLLDDTLDWEDMAKKGHIAALAKTLSPEYMVSRLRDLRWSFITTDNGKLVLGDFGPLALDSETKQLAPLSAIGKHATAVFLPVAHNLLALGYKRDRPEFEIAHLTERTIACSSEFIISATDILANSNALGKFGSASRLVPDEKLQSVFESAFAKGETIDNSVSLPLSTIKFVTIQDTSVPHWDQAQSEIEHICGGFLEYVPEEDEVTNLTVTFRVVENLPDSIRELRRKASPSMHLGSLVEELPNQTSHVFTDQGAEQKVTILVSSNLWETSPSSDQLSRYFAILLELVSVLRPDLNVQQYTDCVEGELVSYQDRLERVAYEILARYELGQITASLIGHYLSVLDSAGAPLDIRQSLLLRRLPLLKSQLLDVSQHIKEIVVPYREYSDGQQGLQDLLRSTHDLARVIMIDTAFTVSFAGHEFEGWLLDQLVAMPGFVEFMSDGWEDFAQGLQSDTSQNHRLSLLISAIRGLQANMGVYVDDVSPDVLDVIVGTPTIIDNNIGF